MDIQDYPELKEALAALINVHHDSLGKFEARSLDAFKRSELEAAYLIDICQGELQAVLMDGDIAAELAESMKIRGTTDELNVTGSRIILNQIDKIAQLMGPYLREIERSNNEKDRINE